MDDTEGPTSADTKRCPNCGGTMRLAPSAPVIEEHHLKGVLSGLEFPMVAHRPAWICQNPTCEYIEPVSQ